MFLIILVDAVKDSMAALLYQPVKAAAPSAAMPTNHAYSISSEMPQIVRLSKITFVENSGVVWAVNSFKVQYSKTEGKIHFYSH